MLVDDQVVVHGKVVVILLSLGSASCLPVHGLLLRRRRGPRRPVGGRGRRQPRPVGAVRRRRLRRATRVVAARRAAHPGAAALDAARGSRRAGSGRGASPKK